MSLPELAMFSILPLMVGWHGRSLRSMISAGGARPRVWLALMVGHVAAWIVPADLIKPIVAFVMIDLLTAAVILTRPAGEQQKLIGMLSAGMAITGIGYFIATEIMGNVGQPGAYVMILQMLGWLQIIILAVWGTNGNLEHLIRRRGNFRGVSPPDKRGFS